MFRLAMCMVACAAGGLTAAVVRMPGDKPLPKAPAIQAKLKVPLPVWLPFAGCRPLALPERSAEKADGEGIGYLDKFALAGASDQPDADGEIKPLEVTTADKRTHCLVVRLKTDGSGKEKDAIDKYVGWVDKRYLLLKPACLEVDTVKLHRKAMVVRSRKDIQDKGQEGKFFTSPALTGFPSEEHTLHQTFFVYAEAPIDPDDPKKGTALLLGTSPRFSPLAKPDELRKTVFGWGNSAGLCQWNTREGVEFNADTFSRRAEQGDRATVYTSRELAQKALELAKKRPTVPGRDEQTTEEIEWLLREPCKDEVGTDGKVTRKPFPYDPQTMRIAVLNKFDDEKGRLYEVGLPGPFFDATGKQLMEAPEAEWLKQRMRLVQEGLKKIEVVFVVGRGEWADAWAGPIKAVVAEIVTTAAEAGDLRVGMVVYGNTADDITKLDLAAADGGEEKLKDALKGLKTRGSTERTMPVLAAVQAAAAMGFDHTSYGRKLVVVCGHFGDDSDKGAKEFKGLAERFAGKNRPTPIELLPIHLTDQQDAGAEVTLFETQMRALGQALDERSKQQKMPFATNTKVVSVNRATEKEKVKKTILARYEELKKEQEGVSGMYVTAQRVGTGGIIRGEAGEAARRIAERNGFGRLGDGQQVFHTGFVWENSLHHSTPQLRRRILVNKKELEDVVRAVAQIRQPPPNTSLQERLKAGAVALIQGAVGYEDETPAEALRRANGLHFHSQLLKRELSKSDEKPNEENETELRNIYLRGYKLADIGAGKEYAYKPSTGPEVWEKASRGEDVDRSFPLGGKRDADKQFKWYWIDFEREWP